MLNGHPNHCKVFAPKGKYLNKILWVDRTLYVFVKNVESFRFKTQFEVSQLFCFFSEQWQGKKHEQSEKEMKANGKFITQTVHCKHPSSFDLLTLSWNKVVYIIWIMIDHSTVLEFLAQSDLLLGMLLFSYLSNYLNNI